MTLETPVHILAISGSLRQASSNSALVTALVRLAPPGVRVKVFDGLGAIPPFNPDLDHETRVPDTVTAFRRVLDRSDSVVISSPEYAHGVPGVLKNALDWLVGSGELMGKPIAVVNASLHATHAHRSLVETLTVMSARVIPEASLTLPLQGRGLDADAIIRDGLLSASLTAVVESLAAASRATAA